MYKKITHHIVEEHFDHPIAAELKKKVDKTSMSPTTNKPTPKPKFHPDKRTNPKSKGYIEVYDYSPLSDVEKKSISYFGQLAWRIRSLVISITSGDEDVDLLKTRLASDINNISDIVKVCYGEDAATKFSKLLTDVALALIDVVIKIKADKDTTDTMKILGDANVALGDFLEKADSKNWPSKAVVDIFTQIENLYIMQTISRIKKEWAAGVSAADNAYDIFVVKQDNGDPSFADIFSKGIICCMENSIENEIEEAFDYMEA